MVYRAGRLHDIGKIGIPDKILRKPAALTEQEYETVKQHVALGDLIVRDLPDLAEIRAGIRHHHERWDGKGYLHHLAGEDIPEVARILAVCDAFSAMTTTRPYRKALSVDEALTRLEDAAGSQLDERLVIAFVTGIRTVATAPLPGTIGAGSGGPAIRWFRPAARWPDVRPTTVLRGPASRRLSVSGRRPRRRAGPADHRPAAAGASDLGTADNYALVANTTITNTGVTLIDGNLALVGPSVTGFGPGVITGRSDIGNAAANTAEADVLAAHHDATGAAPVTEMAGDLGGKTLVPGVYHFGVAATLHGTLTLDGQGKTNPLFIFQIGSTLTTGTGARVVLTRGAAGCAVFWAVGSSATIGTATSLQGNLMALVSITMNTGASIGVGGGRNGGRAFAQNGAITLDTNTVIPPSGSCLAPAPTPEPTPRTARPRPRHPVPTLLRPRPDARPDAADTARRLPVRHAACRRTHSDRIEPRSVASCGVRPGVVKPRRRSSACRQSTAPGPTTTDRLRDPGGR